MTHLIDSITIKNQNISMILDKTIANPDISRNELRSIVLNTIKRRSDVFKISTIRYIIELYNTHVFDGRLDGVCIDVRWNRCFSHWAADCSGMDNKIILRLSTKLFSHELVNVFGFDAKYLTKLEILMLIVEHELVHGITQLFYKRRYVSIRKGVDQTHNYYFMRTVKRLFGHTTHQIVYDDKKTHI